MDRTVVRRLRDALLTLGAVMLIGACSSVEIDICAQCTAPPQRRATRCTLVQLRNGFSSYRNRINPTAAQQLQEPHRSDSSRRRVPELPSKSARHRE